MLLQTDSRESTRIVMRTISSRNLFNWIGGAIVILWIGMVGLLIQKTHFQKQPQLNEVTFKPGTIKGSEQDWMEIFLKGSKVGYSMTRIDPLGDNYLVWEEVALNLNLMGQASAMLTEIRSLLDQQFQLKHFTLKVKSGAVRFQILGRVEGEKMQVQTGEGAHKMTHAIELPGPSVTGAAMSMFFKGRELNKGDYFAFPLFDPTTMARKTIVVSVVEKESIVINRIVYPAFRLETEMWGQKVTLWLDERGDVLKEEGFMGLTLIRSSAAAAPRDLQGAESDDFYEMASIDVKPKLRQPERLTYLKLKVKGLEKTSFRTDILNRGRQRFSGDLLEITQEKIGHKTVYDLPWTGSDEDIKAQLKPGLNVQSNDEAIVNQARKIMKGTKDPVVAAKKLLMWVYDHVEKRPVLSIPSAMEVLKTRVGDCNEHAVLLTALLRAAGIPARECVGLVYVRGRFFYHAWTEAYIGQWVSIDATLNQMPTDATHIRLAHGGLERQTDVIPLIGKIELSVIDYGYDPAY